MNETSFEEQSLATARAVVVFMAAFFVLALGLGILNGTIHLEMFDRPPPGPNDPITIP